jgi:hypothetical protein
MNILAFVRKTTASVSKVDTKAGAKTAEERHRESLETQQQLIEAMAKRRHEAVALVKKRNARVTTPRTALATSRSMPTSFTDLNEVRRFAPTFSLARLRMRSCVHHCVSDKIDLCAVCVATNSLSLRRPHELRRVLQKNR